jgi:hypothetical protein
VSSVLSFFLDKNSYGGKDQEQQNYNKHSKNKRKAKITGEMGVNIELMA